MAMCKLPLANEAANAVAYFRANPAALNKVLYEIGKRFALDKFGCSSESVWAMTAMALAYWEEHNRD